MYNFRLQSSTFYSLVSTAIAMNIMYSSEMEKPLDLKTVFKNRYCLFEKEAESCSLSTLKTSTET